jgi:hypothetical protein
MSIFRTCFVCLEPNTVRTVGSFHGALQESDALIAVGAIAGPRQMSELPQTETYEV